MNHADSSPKRFRQIKTLALRPNANSPSIRAGDRMYAEAEGVFSTAVGPPGQRIWIEYFTGIGPVEPDVQTVSNETIALLSFTPPPDCGLILIPFVQAVTLDYTQTGIVVGPLSFRVKAGVPTWVPGGGPIGLQGDAGLAAGNVIIDTTPPNIVFRAQGVLNLPLAWSMSTIRHTLIIAP